MAVGLIFEFEGVTQAQYDAVNVALGLDTESGAGNWPDGLMVHSAGLDDDGRFVLMEVWESREQETDWMDSHLGAAVAEAGVTAPPSRLTWVELFAHHIRGGLNVPGARRDYN